MMRTLVAKCSRLALGPTTGPRAYTYTARGPTSHDESSTISGPTTGWLPLLIVSNIPSSPLASSHPTPPQPPSKLCLKKLAQELKLPPVPGIALAPASEDNITVWHGNMTFLSGAYAGVNLHVLIECKDNYPLSAPDLYFRSENPLFAVP